jgi:hypothetical protein
LEEDAEKKKNVLEAAKQAGHELVKKGRMSTEALEAVSQPLASEEKRVRRYNYTQKGAKNTANK